MQIMINSGWIPTRDTHRLLQEHTVVGEVVNGQETAEQPNCRLENINMVLVDVERQMLLQIVASLLELPLKPHHLHRVQSIHHGEGGTHPCR